MNIMKLLPGVMIVGVIGLALFAVLKSESNEPVDDVDIEDRGYQLFVALRCTRCHGKTLEGSPQGPPLHDVARHWDEEALAVFLTNPDSFRVRDERLRALAESYPQNMMPEYPLEPALLDTLTAFILEPRR